MIRRKELVLNIVIKSYDEHGYEHVMVRFRPDCSISLVDGRIAEGRLLIDLSDPKFAEIKAIEILFE